MRCDIYVVISAKLMYEPIAYIIWVTQVSISSMSTGCLQPVIPLLLPISGLLPPSHAAGFDYLHQTLMPPDTDFTYKCTSLLRRS